MTRGDLPSLGLFRTGFKDRRRTGRAPPASGPAWLVLDLRSGADVGTPPRREAQSR